MFGSAGILPMIGLIGPLLGGGAGGGFGGGFMLLSGLVGGLLNGNQFPGYGDGLTHPGYGTHDENFLLGQDLQADLSAYGSFNGYFGNGQAGQAFGAGQFYGSQQVGAVYGAQQGAPYGAQYGAAVPQYQQQPYQYAVAPPTYANAFFGQAGYAFSSHGAQYAAPAPPPRQTQPYPAPAADPVVYADSQSADGRQVVLNITINGDLSRYAQRFNTTYGGQQQQYGFVDPYGATMNYSGQIPSYGQVAYPQQGYYGAGQQFYGQAATLYAHQSGAAVWLNYPPIQVARPSYGAGYGSPTYGTAPTPGGSYNDGSVRPVDTVFSVIPRINDETNWPLASQLVDSRLVGGNPHSRGHITFGGTDPRVNSDGFVTQRMAAWHVFRHNDSLRLDMDTGYFFNTNADGSYTNVFHMSQVAAVERLANGDTRLGSRLVRNFLDQVYGVPDVAAQPRPPRPQPQPQTQPQPQPQAAPPRPSAPPAPPPPPPPAAEAEPTTPTLFETPDKRSYWPPVTYNFG